LSPILVRPVREQLEHDRVIRLLQAKYKRKFDVAINPGNEQSAPVGNGPSPWYPDLVLQERGRKLVGVVEVETTESVNNLEAMSQWVAFGKLRAQFHLYVPAATIDSTRRLCTDLAIPVAEIWAYHSIGDQLRFTLVQKSASAIKVPSEPREPREAEAAPAKPAVNGSGRVSAAAPVKPVEKLEKLPKPVEKLAKPADKPAKTAKGDKPETASAKAKAPSVAPAPKKAAKPAPAPPAAKKAPVKVKAKPVAAKPAPKAVAKAVAKAVGKPVAKAVVKKKASAAPAKSSKRR
jgi:hypothetical protein